ncbi:hypothetical protein GCM10010420_42390 [Streptomyces glaucosporus]|uniref:Uncharacterized protein n=1 Tax=Streptomyces glaucosporus TaxID=284044 RepID=A0ABN3IQ82_9ACTN
MSCVRSDAKNPWWTAWKRKTRTAATKRMPVREGSLDGPAVSVVRSLVVCCGIGIALPLL